MDPCLEGGYGFTRIPNSGFIESTLDNRSGLKSSLGCGTEGVEAERCSSVCVRGAYSVLGLSNLGFDFGAWCPRFSRPSSLQWILHQACRSPTGPSRSKRVLGNWCLWCAREGSASSGSCQTELLRGQLNHVYGAVILSQVGTPTQMAPR